MLRGKSGENGAAVRASALLHAGFVFTGVVTTLLGPILPSLSSRWALTDVQAGYLFTAQFVGSMVGVAFSGRLVARFGFRAALAGAYALLTVGVALLALLPWPLTLVSLFTYGIGLGLAIPATNLCVSDTNPHRRAAALNILNLAWGMGAVLSAPLVALFNRFGSTQTFLRVLAVVLGVFAWALLWTGSGLRRYFEADVRQRGSLLRSGVLSWVILGAIFYLYVGTESAIAGWLASFAERIGGNSSSWMLAPSFLWGALLTGRAVSSIILRSVAQIRVALVGLLVATGGIIVLISSNSSGAVFVAATLAGFGLAPVYPIAIALLSDCFGAASPRIAPVMFALASVGGATLPWIVGAVSTHYGRLRAGLFIPLATTVLMALLYAGASTASVVDSRGIGLPKQPVQP